MASFLATVNGFDLLLTIVGAAGWLRWHLDRTPPATPVTLERRPYNWQEDGL